MRMHEYHVRSMFRNGIEISFRQARFEMFGRLILKYVQSKIVGRPASTRQPSDLLGPLPLWRMPHLCMYKICTSLGPVVVAAAAAADRQQRAFDAPAPRTTRQRKR